MDGQVVVPVTPAACVVPPKPTTRSWKVKLLLLLVCFACAIFTQYQSVAPCLFIFHATYLSFIHIEKSFWKAYLASLFLSFGLALSMSQVFRADTADPTSWDWFSAGICLGIQAGVMHAFFLFALINKRLASISSKNLLVFCYPVLVTTAYTIASLYTPIASQASMAYALSEWLSFVQIVSVFGLSGLNFVIVLTSACIAHYYVIDEWNERKNFASRLGFFVFIVTWLFGSFRLAAPFIYQRGVEEIAPSTSQLVKGACITGDGQPDVVLAATTKLLTEQPDTKFVVWSEAAGGTVYDDTVGGVWKPSQQPRLSNLLSEVTSLAQASDATILITYLTWAYPNDVNDAHVLNKLTVVSASENKSFTKRFPVPVIENDVIAGDNDLLTVAQSPVGGFNAGICYDLDHPAFVRSGLSSGLLVQSANTWGVVGHFHAISSSFRAIENGVFLLRCGSNGPSGIYDPYGQSLLYDVRKDAGVMTFHLPQSPERLWTFYSNAGFVIDYVLFVAAGFFILLFVMSFKRSLRVRALH
jgi:apolipoprotein N-acyltransferase